VLVCFDILYLLILFVLFTCCRVSLCLHLAC